MVDKIKVAFIGCGNMGGALASCASKSGCSLMLCDADEKKADELAAQTGGATADLKDCCEQADYIFMAVKPQVIGAVLSEMSGYLSERNSRFVIVSMAAGVEIASLRKYLTVQCPIIRIMPNTPAAIGQGVILYCGDKADDKEINEFCEIMSCAGMLDALPERSIDAASALSGCGPAFVYQFIEALADGAVDCGLTRDKATAYAEQTVAGAALLALSSGRHPGALKDAVCSPGGSTIEGVRALEAGGFRSAAIEAVIAAYEKTKQLGK